MTTETAPVTGTDTPTPGVQQTVDAAAPAAKVEAAGTPAEATDTSAEVVYEFSLPEGIEKDDAATAEFTSIAKELKLPKEAAQKVVDLAIKREQARAEAFTKTVQSWEDTVKTDKDIGGDKLPETLAVCRKAIDLGPPELRDLLNSTKMGSHPAVVKWAYAVGKALSEDKHVAGGAAPATGKTTANVLYPNQS